MSSTLKAVEGDWLLKPMIIEFSSWIKDAISERMQMMGYEPMSPALNDALNECLSRRTNFDYLACTDILTRDLEETLTYHGIKSNDAIRLSWKWSD